jgi:hypothetical protein
MAAWTVLSSGLSRRGPLASGLLLSSWVACFRPEIQFTVIARQLEFADQPVVVAEQVVLSEDQLGYEQRHIRVMRGGLANLVNEFGFSVSSISFRQG